MWVTSILVKEMFVMMNVVTALSFFINSNAYFDRLTVIRLETSFVYIARFKGFINAGKDTVNSKIVSDITDNDLLTFLLSSNIKDKQDSL